MIDTVLKLRFMWSVVHMSGEVDTGVVDSFAEAMRALETWHGASDIPFHSYMIFTIQEPNRP